VARTAEYSDTELLIFFQVYIKTSENAIEGTLRRQSTFWDDVSGCVISLGSLGSNPIRERKGQSNDDILLTISWKEQG
jgi:hypothetical protein